MMWIYDSEGDYVIERGQPRWLDNGDIREKYNVSNDQIFDWVYEGLICRLSGNTRFASTCYVSVNEHVLESFLREKHPEIITKNGT